MHRYEIVRFCSDEDAAHVAEVPESPGRMAHGDTREEALRNIREAMSGWIEVARELGRAISQPHGRLMYA